VRCARALEWALENSGLLRDEMVRRYVEHVRSLLDAETRKQAPESGQRALEPGERG